ncbi:MAG TPA: BTAD domain-containing putative transcriptional regulator [Streptosporangiaceae bacterium]|jgi:DNA-binding SARP family transcriptional activator
MAAELKFGLLGLLEVRRDNIPVPIAAGRQRALLAVLLLHAGTVVPVDELVEALWSSGPPASARASLHNYVKRLRAVLRDVGHELVVTRPQGYLIKVEPGALDVARFEELLVVAREAARAGGWERAAGQARAALALWRGEPLADTGSDVLALREVPRLAEMRLQALELAIDASLHLGRQAELVGELHRLVAEQPLRERLHALLVLALYRDGRQGEALAAYQDARRVLVEELGSEPGPGLRELHQRILTGDPALNEAPPQSAGPADRAAAACTLPRDSASFTGRSAELARVTTAANGAGTVVRIQAIGGMAGVGKTAFAVHAAHRLTQQFPDGQLFVPLHGHTPGHHPADPAEALSGLLVTVGFPAARIPPGLAERAGLWRDYLAGKRVLLVLDDAVGSDQVEPLLPGTAGSLVLVTSRRHLTALADAQVIGLDVLPAREAAALLVRLAARPGLLPGDPAVAEVCELCGHLPLAIGMLARQLRHHPAWTLAALAAELASTRDRLELMTAENLSVAAAFDLSYADLDPDHRRLFRRLGLHPGSDIDGYAAAVLDGCSLAAARHGLQLLYEHHLLTESGARRYRLHDLLREHAHACALREETPPGREAAARRLLDYYIAAASLAEKRLARQTRPAAGLVWSAPEAAVPDLSDGAKALAWARTERANLLACLDLASVRGDDLRVVALTAALAAPLRLDGSWADVAARHLTAARAARRCGDRLGQANAIRELGVAHRLAGDCPRAAQVIEHALGISRGIGDRLGQANALRELGVVWQGIDHPRATAVLAEALEHYRALGDRLGQANALLSLGVVHRLTGNYADSARGLEQALRFYRELDDPLGQTTTLINLGMARQLIGDYPGSAEVLEEALGISRDLGERLNQASALANLGALRRSTGDYPGSLRALEEALRLFREFRERLGQANVLLELAKLWRETGGRQAARRALAEALRLYQDLGDRGSEAEALNEIGTLHRLGGDLALAEACHREALELAQAVDASWDEAYALAGLGRCALAAGRAADAEVGLRQAHQVFQRIGAAEAADVAAELDTLAGAAPASRHSAW